MFRMSMSLSMFFSDLADFNWLTSLLCSCSGVSAWTPQLRFFAPQYLEQNLALGLIVMNSLLQWAQIFFTCAVIGRPTGRPVGIYFFFLGMEIFMSDDKKFIDRIARSLYAEQYKISTWDSMSEEKRQFWRDEAERFIEAANETGIALYDVDDHRWTSRILKSWLSCWIPF